MRGSRSLELLALPHYLPRHVESPSHGGPTPWPFFPAGHGFSSDIKPGKDPISLALGDPHGAVPDFVTRAIADSASSFGNYPAITGSDDWRQAAADWLNRRFQLGGAIDAEKNLLPLNGTREGLFSVLFPLIPETKAGARPIVAMPNPFYQCYAAAALSSGAEPLYVGALKENGFLPDFAGLSEGVLERMAAVYICSPSNPEGAVADRAYWEKLFALAERHDFIVLADECYADIYFGQEPVSALTAWQKLSSGFCAPALLPFALQTVGPARPALRPGGGRCGSNRKIPRLPQCRRSHGACAAAGRQRSLLARRGACGRQPRRLSGEDGGSRSHPPATG